jgi:hypothetical protein
MAGEVIATALYPRDETTFYGWGRSSERSAWHCCPNEFLQWSAIEVAANQGLCFYNVCSYGQFFGKFGGTLQEVARWHKF